MYQFVVSILAPPEPLSPERAQEFEDRFKAVMTSPPIDNSYSYFPTHKTIIDIRGVASDLEHATSMIEAIAIGLQNLKMAQL